MDVDNDFKILFDCDLGDLPTEKLDALSRLIYESTESECKIVNKRLADTTNRLEDVSNAFIDAMHLLIIDHADVKQEDRERMQIKYVELYDELVKVAK